MRQVLLAMCLLAACGDNLPSSGVTVRFSLRGDAAPAPLVVPFPSDIYRESDGTLSEAMTDWTLAGVENPEPSAMFAQYGATDGFGLQSGVLFSIDGLEAAESVDPASLTADRFRMIAATTGTEIPCTVGYDAYAKVIALVPRDVLAPGTLYIAAMLTGPTVAGAPIGASADLERLRDGGGTASLFGGALYGDALARLTEKTGVARKDIIAITAYTTATTHTPLQGTVDRLFGNAYGPAPQLLTADVAAPYRSTRFGRAAHDGWTATLGAWLGTARKAADLTDLPGAHTGDEPGNYGLPHDAIAAVVTGTIVSPYFPRAFAATASYDDGTTAYDADGNAIAAKPTAQVPVVIVLPSTPMPASGFPVVMFQHGLGGERMTALAIANELARAGFATVAIDAPFHGMRDPGAVDVANNSSGTYHGPDGFADAPNPLILLEVVGNLRSMLATRDNLWQFSLDLVSLRRMVDVADLSSVSAEFAGIAPKLDASHVAFIGWSLGGLVGTTFGGVVSGDWVDPVVLVSPASNLRILFADSPVYAAQSTLLAAAMGVRAQSFDAGQYGAVLNILEGLAAAGDTGAFAPLLAQAHNVWLLTADQDESVPHASSDQLARAFGAKQLAPNVRVTDLPQVPSPLTGDQVAGYFSVSPGNHAHTFERYGAFTYEPPYPRAEEPRFVELPAKVKIRQPVVGEQRAIVAFIQSTFAGTPAISIDFPGLNPVSDFDDDGFCDATETSAGTSALDAASTPAGAPDCMRALGY